MKDMTPVNVTIPLLVLIVASNFVFPCSLFRFDTFMHLVKLISKKKKDVISYILLSVKVKELTNTFLLILYHYRQVLLMMK